MPRLKNEKLHTLLVLLKSKNLVILSNIMGNCLTHPSSNFTEIRTDITNHICQVVIIWLHISVRRHETKIYTCGHGEKKVVE